MSSFRVSKLKIMILELIGVCSGFFAAFYFIYQESGFPRNVWNIQKHVVILFYCSKTGFHSCSLLCKGESPLRAVKQNLQHTLLPSFIYSCSIGHILEHEFCHLGCWAVLGKISETTKILLKYATF